jgi:hypothetical protein
MGRNTGSAACHMKGRQVLMGQYMLLLAGRATQPQATDAETRNYSARWMEYFGALARSGALRSGAPFADTGKVVQLGAVSDIELGEVDIGGFLLIEAESAEAAAQIAEQAPHIALGGSVIVRPCLEVPPPPGSSP